MTNQKAEQQEPVGKVMFVAHRKAPDVDWAAGVEIRDGAKLYTTPPSVEAAIEATKEKAAGIAAGMLNDIHAYGFGVPAAIRSMK